MRFFTLIHIQEKEKSMHNVFVASFSDQIRLYLSCARQLASAFENIGLSLTVITNNQTYLKSIDDSYPYPILELPFSTQVPSGIKFYSAHYKLEIYAYLASLKDSYVGLIDCDLVCINTIPDSLKNAINKGIPLYYDITNQVAPAYGLGSIIKDKEKLLLNESIGTWAGGEFIAGPTSFFAELSLEVNSLKERYFSISSTFRHQGDEMITSSALERLKRNVLIEDAGSLMIVKRFWSVNPKHPQSKFDSYLDYFLLHLPSDKKFIASLKSEDTYVIGKKYKIYLNKKAVFRRIFKPFFPLLKYLITKFRSKP